MKTNYLHKNPFLLLVKVLFVCTSFFCITATLQGCAAKPLQQTHTIERIIELSNDSVKTTNINAAILDSLIIQVAKVKTVKPECDSITQATLDQVLKQLNASKKSGGNEAKVYYDDLLKQIIVILKQRETKTEKTDIRKTDKDSSKEKEIIKVPVKYIPWWVKWLAYWGFSCLLYLAWRISRIWL